MNMLANPNATHHDGCWRTHPECAAAKAERAEASADRAWAAADHLMRWLIAERAKVRALQRFADALCDRLHGAVEVIQRRVEPMPTAEELRRRVEGMR